MIDVQVASPDQMQKMILERVNGTEYWTFLVQPSGMFLLEAIENTFYEKGGIEVYMIPPISVALCHKRRMSRGQLMWLLHRECEIKFPKESSPEADIMVLSDGISWPDQELLLCSFAAWLSPQGGRPGRSRKEGVKKNVPAI